MHLCFYLNEYFIYTQYMHIIILHTGIFTFTLSDCYLTLFDVAQCASSGDEVWPPPLLAPPSPLQTGGNKPSVVCSPPSCPCSSLAAADGVASSRNDFISSRSPLSSPFFRGSAARHRQWEVTVSVLEGDAWYSGCSAELPPPPNPPTPHVIPHPLSYPLPPAPLV